MKDTAMNQPSPRHTMRHTTRKKSRKPGKTTVSVGAVIIDSGKKHVLIAWQIKDDYWVFPKGRVKPGETEEQTLRREIQEEVGITDFTILPGFKEEMLYDFELASGKPIHRKIIYYVIHAKNRDFKIGVDEIKEARWLTFNEAVQYLKYGNQHALLAKVKSYLHV